MVGCVLKSPAAICCSKYWQQISRLVSGHRCWNRAMRTVAARPTGNKNSVGTARPVPNLRNVSLPHSVLPEY